MISSLDNTCTSVNLSEIGEIVAIGFATRGIKLHNESYNGRNYKGKQNIQKKMMATCHSKACKPPDLFALLGPTEAWHFYC